jgi:hypothetical protein
MVNLAVLRSLVAFDVSSKLVASFMVIFKSGEQRNLDFNDFAHFHGLLKVPGAEVLQVNTKVKEGVKLVVCNNESGNDVETSREEGSILLVADNNGCGRDSGGIQRFMVDQLNTMVGTICAGVGYVAEDVKGCLVVIGFEKG